MYVLKTRNWSVLNSRRNEYAPTRAFLRHYTERLQTKNRKRKNLTRTKDFVLGFYLWTEVDWQSQSVVVQKPYCLFGLFRFSLLARTTANTACFLPPTPPKRRHLTGVFFLVDRGGFEPPKSETSDLQSDPFGRSGICPFRSVQQCKLWSRWLDSNPQPADYKSAALPIELHRRMVPQGGIEPPTQGFSVPCSTNWAIEACPLIGRSPKNG